MDSIYILCCLEEPRLRHVEKDVLIPKMVREKAKELCSDKVEDFTKCCQQNGFFMVVKCREENAALKECLTGHLIMASLTFICITLFHMLKNGNYRLQSYQDTTLYEECKEQYLKEREEFQKTGIPSKKRQQKVSSSM
ncbi:COX assembly mitochondrial protein homolog isoform X3 [Narcine bancroftii]